MIRIFYFTDNRPGNNAQTQGVAAAAEKAFAEQGARSVAFPMAVTYTALAGPSDWLPTGAALSDSSKSLLRGTPGRAVFIAAGRRQSEALRYLQSLKQKKPFCVQLMLPGRGASPDLLMLPMHDKEPKTLGGSSRTIRLIGAPNLTPSLLRKEGEMRRRNMWSLPIFAGADSILGVLVGGAVKKRKPSRSDMLKAADKVMHMQGVTVFAFSRRTPPELKDILLEARPDALVLGEGELAGAGMIDLLAAADKLAVTGDSVSMLSEACATGRMVEILPLPSVMRPKHLRFVNALEQLGYADGSAPPLDDARTAGNALVEMYLADQDVSKHKKAMIEAKEKNEGAEGRA